MYLGVIKLLISKSNRQLHIKIMSTAMIWDVLLILQIELNRGAINKASKAVENPLILNIHVILALLSVLCYIAMTITGKKILNGKSTFLRRHRLLGRVTILLRTMTYITSFFAS